MRCLFAMGLLFCSALPRLEAAALSCESSPAMAAARWQVNQKLETATFEESNALFEQAHKELPSIDPLDFRPLRQYLSHVRYSDSSRWEAVRERTLAEAQADPNNPLKVTAAVLVLAGKDTPQAFRLMNQVIASNPNYAPAYPQLASMYSGYGKFIDNDKAATYLSKYYELCPGGRDDRAIALLKRSENKVLREQVAKDLRKRLATAKDELFLNSYADVWSLEFASLPPAQHPQERQRVTEDLKRLEQLPIKPSSSWLAFLRDGYKQSSTPDKVDALESRILREYSHSSEALDVVSERWEGEHPEPNGEASVKDWQEYLRLSLAHYRDLEKTFPGHTFGSSLFEAVANLDGGSNEEIIRQGESLLKQNDLYQGPSSWVRVYVATVWMDHDLEPARALALLKEARQLRESPQETVRSQTADYAKQKELDDAAKNAAWSKASFNVNYLRACRAAGDKAAAEQVKATLDAAPPTEAILLPKYWQERAILAEIEGHTTDALAFYQKALFLRDTKPNKQYGKVRDLVLADAHRLWIVSQGSEAAFVIWSQPDTTAKTALADGRWEKPGAELPAFELSDLQGKTWKLVSLEGKKVLINIWATWCGPCQQELPHLEKLYQQTKDRTDIAILTLNFDEDSGLIDPFVKKKGYTFPVLPAYAFLRNKIDVNSIPRNWLINSNGKWQWEQIGFGSGEADWEKSMLARLEDTK